MFELETQIELACRLGFVREGDGTELPQTIRGLGRSLTALMRYVQTEAAAEKKRYS